MKVKIAAATIIGWAAIGALYSTLHAQLKAPPQQAPAQSPAETSRSVWDGVYREEQAKRGEALYRKECASCHGAELMGGETAPPLVGGAFLANWNGLTLGDLFERIRRTMPQDDPGRLSRRQDADILAHMLAVNSFPAGKTELEHQTELLKQIRFEAIKP